MNQAHEALAQTLGCYLHQDWMLEYASEDLAIDAILEECAPEHIVAAALDIARLLASSSSEVELRAAMTETGCYFYPPGAGLTYRHWLSGVRDRFAAKGS